MQEDGAMRLLVLGGRRIIKKKIVEAALERGDEVTTVTRGVSGPSAAGARAIHVDRTDRVALTAALGDSTWDVALDTWSDAARVVHDSTELLAERVAHYVYVSSRSVYVWPLPLGSDESAPVVEADPLSDDGSDYAAAKRGAEIAVEQIFGDRTLL